MSKRPAVEATPAPSPTERPLGQGDLHSEVDAATSERLHCHGVCAAFQSYGDTSLRQLREIATDRCGALPLKQQEQLERVGFQKHLKKLERCVALNQGFLRNVLKEALAVFPAAEGYDPKAAQIREEEEEEAGKQPSEKRPRAGLMTGQERVQSTLKQLVRDWSSEGSEERALCYTPIVEELVRIFADRLGEESKAPPVKVLVPGAGLGRLAFELVQMGFDCEANEFSLYMLFAANLVLNQCPGPMSWRIYPWVHQFSNHRSAGNMLREVSLPDIDPNDLSGRGRMSMTAGDFLEIYAAPEYRASKDCVVTCFFIDCARNVLDFIQLIAAVLRPGGRWVNLGPLLYHFSDLDKESSIEPSFENVRKMILDEGFVFEKEQKDVRAKYCQDVKSMLQNEYNCVFFSCVKKERTGERLP